MSSAKVPFSTINTFGELLKFLRRRAKLSQRDISIMVGYSEAQISRLETNQRPPDLTSIQALFVPALGIEAEPAVVDRLLDLAKNSREKFAHFNPPAEGFPKPEELVLPTVTTHPHNLPLERTTFIGREKEIAALVRLLDHHRMVTITGSGGTGKTRLSLRTAAEVLKNYPKGTWLIELASLADPALVLYSTAKALGLPEKSEKDIEQALVDFLKEKRLLLIMDNCEHLVETCAALADRLLSSCPELTILGTSREILGIEGEAAFRIPPLSVPDPRNLPALENLMAYDAMRLFVERAGVVSPGFILDESNAKEVIAILQRLDGIPLAIELAASRMRLLGVDEIVARLNDVFRLITGGSRNKVPRHQTLRVCIDWSYDLLSDPEKTLVRRLSVFSGGWNLQAAETVCSGGLIDPTDFLDLLTRLLDKSLINAAPVTTSYNRYSMLETVRQYALEKLVDEGEEVSLRTRHMQYYQQFVEAIKPTIRGREQIETLNRLELEIDNLRLALAWGLQTDLMAELRIATGLKWFWLTRQTKEGVDWLEQGLNRLEATPVDDNLSEDQYFVRASALETLGNFYYSRSWDWHHSSYLEKGRQILEKSLSLFGFLSAGRASTARSGKGWALLSLGLCKGEMGRLDEAQRFTQEAFGLFQAAGDFHGMADCNAYFGVLEFYPNKKIPFHTQQLALEKENGDVAGIAFAFAYLGGDYFLDAEYEQSQAFYNDSRAYYQQVKNHEMIANTWGFQGSALLFLGNIQQARLCIVQSVTLFEEYGFTGLKLQSLKWLITIEMAEGRFAQAEDLLEQATSSASLLGTRFDTEIMYYRIRLARLTGRSALARKLGEQILSNQDEIDEKKKFAMLELGHLEFEDGNFLQADSLWREAIRIQIKAKESYWLFAFFDALSLVASRSGDTKRAVLLFGSRWVRGYYNTLSTDERLLRDAEKDALKVSLGEMCYGQLYARAKTLTLEQAVTLALEDAIVLPL
jgi:predicted ATPase/transcriptional regulator with XRE-family HTH domain